MKKWIVVLAVVLSGCGTKIANPPTQQIDSCKGIEINADTLEAMRFCASLGKSFREFKYYDWRNIGGGYMYEISCEDKK